MTASHSLTARESPEAAGASARPPQQPAGAVRTLLDRVYVLRGPRADGLAHQLSLDGMIARVAQPAEVDSIVAGLVVAHIGETAAPVLPVLAALRARPCQVATLGLGTPDGASADLLASYVDAVLPETAPAPVIAAQLRALARLIAMSPPSDQPEIVVVRNVRIDLERREVTAGNRVIPLTPTEFSILAVLARRPGRAISVDDIFRELHGLSVEERQAKLLVKVHVFRLRAKLAEFVPEPSPILNVRGFGYMLERRGGRDRRARPTPDPAEAGGSPSDN